MQVRGAKDKMVGSKYYTYHPPGMSPLRSLKRAKEKLSVDMGLRFCSDDDSAGGSRANGDTEDEMKDSCEVDSRSDAADSSDSVPGDVGASSTAGRRLVSQAAQEALDGMHIEEVAEQHLLVLHIQVIGFYH